MLCDDPDLTHDDCLERIRELMTRDRFAVVAVAGSRSAAEFSYSVGLTQQGLPELIVTGLRSDDASALIRLWGAYLLDRSAVLPGETLACGPWSLQAVHVEEPREHLLVADRFFGESVRALQLVWADCRGRWPWDAGHRTRPAGQPLLGARAPYYCEEHALDRLDVPPHL